jgi:hypothetical protein
MKWKNINAVCSKQSEKSVGIKKRSRRFRKKNLYHDAS